MGSRSAGSSIPGPRGGYRVVHLAGENIGARWTSARKARIRSSRFRGPAVERSRWPGSATQAGSSAVGSAIGIYGDRGDEILTESEPSRRPEGLSGFAWPRTGRRRRNLPGRRASGWFTPASVWCLSPAGGALGKMLLPFRLGLGGRLGNGAQWMSWIAIDDVVGAIRPPVERTTAAGPVNVTAPGAGSQSRFHPHPGRVTLAVPRRSAFPPRHCDWSSDEMADGTLLASTRVAAKRLVPAGIVSATPSWSRRSASCARHRSAERSFPGMSRPTAVVLLSGGMDSATTAAIARDEGFDLHALTLPLRPAARGRAGGGRRGGPAARRQPARDPRHRPARLRRLGAHRATSRSRRTRRWTTIGARIPSTYVPARNTIFLSFALAWAEVAGRRDIFIGVNALDYSGYPDCRPEYIAGVSGAWPTWPPGPGSRRDAGSPSTRR